MESQFENSTAAILLLHAFCKWNSLYVTWERGRHILLVINISFGTFFFFGCFAKGKVFFVYNPHIGFEEEIRVPYSDNIIKEYILHSSVAGTSQQQSSKNQLMFLKYVFLLPVFLLLLYSHFFNIIFIKYNF